MSRAGETGRADRPGAAAREGTVVRALAEVQWMARRGGSAAGEPLAAQVDEATHVLAVLLARHRVRPLAPDPVAIGGTSDAVAQPSVWCDGSTAALRDVDAGDQKGVPAWADDEDAVDRVARVLHAAAHAYADGRASYATSMLNGKTRVLLAAGVDLTSGLAAGQSVWVRDAFGDGYAGLPTTRSR